MSSNVSQSWSAPRSNSWHMSLASQAPLAFIPQAKSETADASAVGGDTDEPKQFVSPIFSFCRLPSESTRRSTDSSANPLDTSINVRCLIRTVSTCGTIITDPYPIPSVAGKLESRHNESNLLVDYPRQPTNRLRPLSSSKMHEHVKQFFLDVTKEREGSRCDAVPTALPTTLPYKRRLSLESSRSGIPGVIFPVTSADCLIGCEVASSPISGSSG